MSCRGKLEFFFFLSGLSLHIPSQCVSLVFTGLAVEFTQLPLVQTPPIHHPAIFSCPLGSSSALTPPNFPLLSLNCLLLTLFTAHTSSSFLSTHSPLAPSYILYSWHHILFAPFHPHFPCTSSHPPPPPSSSSSSSALILHHLSIPRLSLVSSFHRAVLPARYPSDSFSSSQTNGGKIWKCQRDQAEDQKGLC